MGERRLLRVDFNSRNSLMNRAENRLDDIVKDARGSDREKQVKTLGLLGDELLERIARQ